ncbi:T9SS type A sorting domain-containing protein [Lentimicrobium sp. S6]|uniref:T9SS type A sorting domain-containing protein n=1 Tax=Lentimicrobium sp. S6 TaxID=2735872 RepID=UPI0015577EA2|nr:T9SS type A sorting domain-containing protein [Lentimicrobium sp. S6]NPD47505.1 T9SS type A sorting domain-containing protein [Lentimicrobium sp. S6]
MKWEYELDEQERPLIFRYYSSLPPNELELKNLSEYEYVETENQYIQKVFSLESPNWDTIFYGIKYYNNYFTAINEVETKEFELSPIPSSYQISLSSEHHFSQNIKYAIYSMSGNRLRQEKLNPSGIVEIKDLAAGHYLIKVYKPNGNTEVLKFQKL